MIVLSAANRTLQRSDISNEPLEILVKAISLDIFAGRPIAYTVVILVICHCLHEVMYHMFDNTEIDNALPTFDQIAWKSDIFRYMQLSNYLAISTYIRRH